MTNAKWCWLSAGILCVTVAVRATVAEHSQDPSKPTTTAAPQKSAATAATPAANDPGAIVGVYCTTCHNDRSKKGDLSLTTFDLAKVTDIPEVGEKMIRKLRAGMMPPPGSKRPEQKEIDALITALETKLDAAYAAHP